LVNTTVLWAARSASTSRTAFSSERTCEIMRA
jgi:hypothetical protein